MLVALAPDWRPCWLQLAAPSGPCCLTAPHPEHLDPWPKPHQACQHRGAVLALTACSSPSGVCQNTSKLFACRRCGEVYYLGAGDCISAHFLFLNTHISLSCLCPRLVFAPLPCKFQVPWCVAGRAGILESGGLQEVPHLRMRDPWCCSSATLASRSWLRARALLRRPLHSSSHAATASSTPAGPPSPSCLPFADDGLACISWIMHRSALGAGFDVVHSPGKAS